MKKSAFFAVALLGGAVLAAEPAVVKKEGGIGFRFDDNRTVKMWQEMAFITGGRLRVVMGTVGDSYVTIKLKNGENSLSLIHKMFENYLETVQNGEKDCE